MTQSNTAGGLYGAGGAAAFGAHSVGHAQSLASAGAAPPQRKSLAGIFVAMLVLGTIVLLIAMANGSAGGFLFAVLLMAGPLYGIYSNHVWNRDQFPRLYAHWDATFQCSRCESRFVPGF